jgi:hypothetical protein
MFLKKKTKLRSATLEYPRDSLGIAMPNVQKNNSFGRRIPRSVKTALSNKAFAFVLSFGIIGSVFVYTNYALNPYGDILTSADELAVRYDLPMSHELKKNDFSQGMPPAMLLYGNGLMLCMDHTKAHANVEVSPLMSLKQRQLSEVEVRAYFEQIRNLGFDSLISRKLPDTPIPPVGSTETLSLTTSMGERRVALYSGEKLDTFSAITAYILDECKKAKDDFSPNEAILESIKLPDMADAQTEFIPDLQLPVAEVDNEVKSTQISGDDSTRIKEVLGKGNKLYKAPDGKKIKVRVLPKIPEYRASNVIKNTKSSNTVSAATFRKIRFLYVVASDQTVPANAETRIRDLATTLPVYYQTQIGKALTSDGGVVVRGSKTAAEYKTCPAELNCQNDIGLASYYNLLKEYKLTNYSTIIMYNWEAANCSGRGGPTNLTGDSATVSDYGLGTLTAVSCSWDGAKEAVGAHEAGHTFGLNHTSDRTIMTSTYSLPLFYEWPVNANQATLLNNSSPWFNGPTEPAPEPISSGTTFVSITPSRLLDTRSGNTTIDGQSAGIGPYQALTVTPVKVAGRAGIPNDAIAAALNIIAINPSGDGFITVFPCGTSVPITTNINFFRGAIISNMVISKLGTDGSVCIYSNVTTDVVIDINGAFPAVSTQSFTNINPVRVLETRPGNYTNDGRYNGIGRLAPGSITQLDLANRLGIPNDVSAVSLNIIAITPQADGYLTVFPCDGGGVPNTSTVAYRAGKIISNATIAKVVGGKVCIYTLSAVDVVVDLSGAFKNVTSFKSVAPARLLETRPGNNTVDGQQNGIGTRAGGSITEVQVTGRAGIPADAIAAVVNVTAVNTQAPGYMTVFPCGKPVPTATNVNYDSAGAIISNTVISQLGSGKICIYTLSSSDIVVDVTGVFTATDTNQTVQATTITQPSHTSTPSTTCTGGYTGTYPNCIAPACPAGYTGTYPNCIAPSTAKCVGTKLYSDVGYRGVSQNLTAGTFNYPLQIGNDTVSSVMIPINCEVILHMHSGFTGPTQVLRFSWSGSVDDPWNDKASSITVREKEFITSKTPLYCPANGVTVYRDSHYLGSAQSLSNGRHDFKKLNLGAGDNNISSVRVKPGCKVKLYQKADFSGPTKVLIGDWNSIDTDEPWNDITSSIVILSFGSATESGTSMLRNGNFDEGMTGWNVSNPSGGILSHSIKTDGGKSGSNYFEGRSNPYGGSLYQSVAIKPTVGETYKLSGWFKSATCIPFYGHLTLWSLWASMSNAHTPFTADCNWRSFATFYTVTNSNDTEFRALIPFNSANVSLHIDLLRLSKMTYRENQ